MSFVLKVYKPRTQHHLYIHYYSNNDVNQKLQSGPTGKQKETVQCCCDRGQLEQHRSKRWIEWKRTRAGTDTWHMHNRKNNHLMGTWNPWHNKQLTLSPSFSPLAVWQTTVTPLRSQTHSHTHTSGLLCGTMSASHISNFLLCGHRIIVWVASHSLSHKDEDGYVHLCVCVCLCVMYWSKHCEKNKMICLRLSSPLAHHQHYIQVYLLYVYVTAPLHYLQLSLYNVRILSGNWSADEQKNE